MTAPQSDAGWIGEAGPGPSYGDEQDDGTRVGLGNEFTNRNTTFMTWNLMHLARILRAAGGFPIYGKPIEAVGRRHPLRFPRCRGPRLAHAR